MDDVANPEIDDAPLSLARDAFREYYARCFWYLDPDLTITEVHLELIARGLRRHGDRGAFMLAQQICP